jgi:hypothetical protein
MPARATAPASTRMVPAGQCPLEQVAKMRANPAGRILRIQDFDLIDPVPPQSG